MGRKFYPQAHPHHENPLSHELMGTKVFTNKLSNLLSLPTEQYIVVWIWWPKVSKWSRKGRAFAAQSGGALVITGSMITNETMARILVDINANVRFGIPGLFYILHRNALVIGAEMSCTGQVAFRSEVVNETAVVP